MSMEKADKLNPIYDDKVKIVLREMAQGKTLEEIANEMDYGNPKSLDIYLRRRNFRINKATGQYEPIAPTREKEVDLPSSAKVQQIISMLDREDADPRLVAKRIGFSDHKEMADYMKGKGYIYDSDIGNYKRKIGQIIEDEKDSSETSKETTHTIKESSNTESLFNTSNENYQEYIEILEILRRNKEKLIDTLILPNEQGKIPMYVIGGTFITKSVHMSNLLDQMIRNFSQEKNINQRNIFEVALIDFFKKYGYEREVQTLLGK